MLPVWVWRRVNLPHQRGYPVETEVPDPVDVVYGSVQGIDPFVPCSMAALSGLFFSKTAQQYDSVFNEKNSPAALEEACDIRYE